jgi:hypothetical protein
MLSSCSNINPSSEEIFKGSPQELLLEISDLPGDYLLMEELSGEKPNQDLTMETDNPDALNAYLERTGRISGWENRYLLIEPTRTLPGFIINQIVVFNSIEGAQTALNWPTAETRQLVEIEPQIGEKMLVTMMPFTTPNGSNWIDYRVEFTYQNLMVTITTYAPEAIATPEYALELAIHLVDNFESRISQK